MPDDESTFHLRIYLEPGVELRPHLAALVERLEGSFRVRVAPLPDSEPPAAASGPRGPQDDTNVHSARASTTGPASGLPRG